MLLLGDTGVGKDLLAEAIHYASNRSSHSFVAINCSSLGSETLESELFGYKAGAFTGAIKDKKGLFEEASEGTIFLDEIGEMSTFLQSRMLRALENKSYIKLGDTKTSFVNCRVIAATNIDLKQSVLSGKFRQDLFYRISSFTIRIPSLIERKKDIPLLVKYFVWKKSLELKITEPEISTAFMKELINYNWPGNIRELINVVERSLILCVDFLTPDLLDLEKENKVHLSSKLLRTIELLHIKKIIDECNGNKTEAAKLLGISTATLYRKIS